MSDKKKYWAAMDADGWKWVYKRKPSLRHFNAWGAGLGDLLSYVNHQNLDLGDDWKTSLRRVELVNGQWQVKQKKNKQKCKHQERKDTPIYSGFLKYFPLAVAEVAKCSRIANEQHNPGKPMHWDRSKSGDELDALARHLVDAGTMDDDRIRHSTKIAWRAMANLQKELEAAK